MTLSKEKLHSLIDLFRQGVLMIVGVAKEIKKDEYRVSMTPDGVEMLVQEGHKVLVQKSAGIGSGFDDDLFSL